MERVPVSITLRALVAVGLLVAFYASGFAILAVLVWLTFALSHIPGALQELAGATVVTAIALGPPLWQILRAGPEPPPGVAVAEDDRPACGCSSVTSPKPSAPARRTRSGSMPRSTRPCGRTPAV